MLNRKCDRKIVFLFIGLSCLILQACSGKDYLYTCSIANLSSNPNPHCEVDPSEGMKLINDGGTYIERDTDLVSDGKWGYANVKTEIVIRPQYDSARNFVEGLASVGLNGRLGFIDKTGKVVIPLQFSEAFSFSEGLAAAKLNGKWGYINKSGRVIIPFKYDRTHRLADGTIQVGIGKKSEVFDKTGKLISK
jgi:hypothetical protein